MLSSWSSKVNKIQLHSTSNLYNMLVSCVSESITSWAMRCIKCLQATHQALRSQTSVIGEPIIALIALLVDLTEDEHKLLEKIHRRKEKLIEEIQVSSLECSSLTLQLQPILVNVILSYFCHIKQLFSGV